MSLGNDEGERARGNSTKLVDEIPSAVDLALVAGGGCGGWCGCCEGGRDEGG